MLDRTLANALGLALRGSTGFRLGESFDAIRRRIVADTTGARPCLAGTWNDRDVLVFDTLAPNAYEGDELVEHRRVHAFARLASPSVLSFSLVPDDGSAHGGLEFPVEPGYVLRTRDPALEDLVTSPTLEVLASLPRDTTVFACDTAVVFTIECAFDATPNVRQLLDDATALAGVLGEALQPLHDSNWHRMVRRAWSSTSARHGLDFDEARFRVAGNLGGLHLRVALEAEPEAITTALDLEMPSDATFPFVLAKQGEVPFFDRILPSRDLRIGDRVFDGTFVVRATDPAATRAILSAPGVASAFVDLVAHTSRFQMDARTIALGWPGPLEAAGSIGAVLDFASTLAQAFVRSPDRGTGPYR